MENSVQQRVTQSLHAAIDEFNSLQPAGQQLEKSPGTVLLGANGKLDSLALVNLLVTVEQQIAADFNAPVTLASEKAFSMRNSPFASVASLAEYVCALLEEKAGD
jgi:acyl carrier protein